MSFNWAKRPILCLLQVRFVCASSGPASTHLTSSRAWACELAPCRFLELSVIAPAWAAASQLGAARVLTSVSTPEKATLARAAGADGVVMYKTEPLARRVADLTAGCGVDRIIELDLGVNAAADLEMLRPNGECVVYGSSI